MASLLRAFDGHRFPLGFIGRCFAQLFATSETAPDTLIENARVHHVRFGVLRTPRLLVKDAHRAAYFSASGHGPWPHIWHMLSS